MWLVLLLPTQPSGEVQCHGVGTDLSTTLRGTWVMLLASKARLEVPETYVLYNRSSSSRARGTQLHHLNVLLSKCLMLVISLLHFPALTRHGIFFVSPDFPRSVALLG